MEVRRSVYALVRWREGIASLCEENSVLDAGTQK